MPALAVVVEIEGSDLLAMEDILVDPEAWIQASVAGKISSCKDTMAERWVRLLLSDPAFEEPIPSNLDQLIQFIVARPEYKNRATRDADEL